MRIGFLGNTNNYPFMLARALRRKGHDVVFLVDSRERLHRPENRYDDVAEAYGRWIHDLSPFTALDCVLPTRRSQRALTALRQCDAVVLNGLGPSLLTRIRRPGLALLTGSDLLHLANLRAAAQADELPTRFGASAPLFWRVLRRAVYAQLVRRQRSGIRAARSVSCFSRGLAPEVDVLLDELGVPDARRWFAYMTDLELIHPMPLPPHPPLRVFSATRLTWRAESSEPGMSKLDWKGAELMIEGLALFWKTWRRPMAVRLVRKGRDVRRTEELARREGIAHLITWLAELTQRQVLEECHGTHVVIEQLAESPMGMAGLDAMAAGRAVIVNIQPELLPAGRGRAAAFLQARTPAEVCDQLEKLSQDDLWRTSVCRAARHYVEEFHSADAAAAVAVQRLQAVV